MLGQTAGEAVDNGVSFATHTDLGFVLFQHLRIVLRSVLHAAIGVVDEAFANCSILAGALFSSRLTMWYVFFTAVLSFRRIVFGESILPNRLRHRRSTFNYDRDTLSHFPWTSL